MLVGLNKSAFKCMTRANINIKKPLSFTADQTTVHIILK